MIYTDLIMYVEMEVNLYVHACTHAHDWNAVNAGCLGFFFYVLGTLCFFFIVPRLYSVSSESRVNGVCNIITYISIITSTPKLQFI